MVVNLVKRGSELGICGRRRNLKMVVRSKENPHCIPRPECHMGWEREWPPLEKAAGEVVIFQRFRSQLEQDSEGDLHRTG